MHLTNIYRQTLTKSLLLNNIIEFIEYFLTSEYDDQTVNILRLAKFIKNTFLRNFVIYVTRCFENSQISLLISSYT